MSKIRNILTYVMVVVLLSTSVPLNIEASEVAFAEKGEFVDSVFVDGVEYEV